MRAMQLTARDLRALKVLVAALVVAGAWLGYGAVDSLRIPSTTIEGLEQRYLLQRDRAQRQPAAAREAVSVRKALDDLEGRLLQSTTAALAQAELRSIATRLLREEGIDLSGSAFGTIVDGSDIYTAIPLALEFACDAGQLVNLLTSMANLGPILATRQIGLQASGPDHRGLHVRLTLEGYLRSLPSPGPVPGGSTGAG